MHKDLNPAAAPAATPSRGRAGQARRLLDAVHGEPPVQERAAPAGEGEGHALLDAGGPPGPRRGGRPLVRECRPCTAEDRRGDRGAGRRDGLRAAVQHGAPEGLRARREARRDRSRRARQGVLHQLGLGSGRHGAEDGDRLPPRPRRRAAHAPDRPRARLSRRQLRRHLGRRHRRQSQELRHHGRRRRSPAPHARPQEERVLARPAGARRRARRRPRADRHAARRIDDRRGDRRAGRRLHRRPASAQGLPRAAARDLRQARHPADLRRGHHRLRPPRIAVRGDPLQGHARPDDGRQGDHQRRRADGRGVRQGRDPRRLHERSRAHGRVPARLHLFRAPARLRGRARHARDLCRRRSPDARREDGAGVRARAPLAARVTERDRHPQHRPGRRHRARIDPGRTRASARSTSSASASSAAC